MSIDTDIRLEAAALDVGQSRKLLCPDCGGGRTGEISLSVTRTTDGILFQCYRASCTTRGYIGEYGRPQQDSATQLKLSTYHHPILPLDDADEQFFWDRFGLANMAGIFVSMRDEYILAITSPLGYSRGYTVRQPVWKGTPQAPRQGFTYPDGSSPPKAKIYNHVAEPMQSFCRSHITNEVLVVVEDQISAMKVAQIGVASVALGGTGVNLAKVREWTSIGAQSVLLALDADATDQAFRIARKWHPAFDHLRVVMLEQDLKDSDNDDILSILGID